MNLTNTQRNVLNEAQIIYDTLATAKKIRFSNPYDVKEFCKPRLIERDREIFLVLFLDNKNNLITTEEVFAGTINKCAIYPREVLKLALRHNAAAIVVAHNHPGGDPDPSSPDLRLTHNLGVMLAWVDIRLIDHIIVGINDTHSMAENNCMKDYKHISDTVPLA